MSPDTKPPLRQPIPNCYVVPGARLIGGEYPFASNPAEARRKLGRILDGGVDLFVDLTTDRDRLAPYEEFLAELRPDRDVKRLHHPIPDMGVPDRHSMRLVLDAID